MRPMTGFAPGEALVQRAESELAAVRGALV
jgi:hypothetical protein